MALRELATFAVSATESKGRVYKEDQSDYRSEFQRDRDRIIHCSAFRRLEYKTQVFVNHVGVMFRTRLTHSIEVAQIGRTIARALNVNEDLTEAICLAHDLGHTPFGHAGQDALNNCMKNFGGFEHNLQSLRIVDVLEERYPNFPGLNLTYETREGILKHCSQKNALELGELGKRFIKNNKPSLEAQIANIADEIAYNNHDIDDGLRANLLNINLLSKSVLFEDNLKEVVKKWKTLNERQIRHEVVRRMINYIVSDLIENSRRLIQSYQPGNVDAVRESRQSLIKMGEFIEKKHNDLKRILRKELYEHEQVKLMTEQAKKTIQYLFDAYMKNPILLTDELQERIKENMKSKNERKKARMIADYIAGMTDRFALSEYKRISDQNK
ncbi:MAG: deoxyguanosinetriphosphate triphosphohydrolase [Pseudomonadota bacterium]|nr:deoxyguanosinetriphosphate triphosphohydrolase [Pseudomonadota bacterium]